MDKFRYLVVEGPIGAGKTSLARRLASRFSADLLLELPEENPFLGRFYQDMARFALPTQLSLPQLKIMQEAITLGVFVPFAVLYMKQPVKLDYLWASLCIVGAVYFVFRG